MFWVWLVVHLVLVVLVVRNGRGREALKWGLGVFGVLFVLSYLIPFPWVTMDIAIAIMLGILVLQGRETARL